MVNTSNLQVKCIHLKYEQPWKSGIKMIHPAIGVVSEHHLVISNQVNTQREININRSLRKDTQF